MVGYSNLATILVPIATRLGWAILHGDSLADTPYQPPAALLSWLDLAAVTGPHVQGDSGVVAEWWPFEEAVRATDWKRVGSGRWSSHGAHSARVTGRLIGGCVDGALATVTVDDEVHGVVQHLA